MVRLLPFQIVIRLACALFAFVITATFPGTRGQAPARINELVASVSRTIPTIPADVSTVTAEQAAKIIRLAEEDAPRSRQHHASGIASLTADAGEFARLSGRGLPTAAQVAGDAERTRTYDANAPPVVA